MTNNDAIKIIKKWLSNATDGMTSERLGYIEGWFHTKDAEAFEMAINALEELSNLPENLHREREQAYMNGWEDGKSTCRWFSVDDKLPEENFSVLVWCPERRNIYCAYYRQGEWYVFGAYNNILKDVIAWLPLPEPYKEEKE